MNNNKLEPDYVIYLYDENDFMCTKCGRRNHSIHNCHANYDIFGCKIHKKTTRRILPTNTKYTHKSTHYIHK